MSWSDIQSDRKRTAIFLILLIALVVRLAAVLLVPDQDSLFSDAASYRQAGQDFWSSLNLNNIYIMPLYPMIAGALSAGWAQTLFDISASVISVWLVYTIAMDVFADNLIALMAALMTALYPPLIFFSIITLTESLFIMLLLATFACWYRGHFTAAAIFAVLSILTRPVLDLAAPVLIVYFSIAIHHLGVRGALRNLAIYGLIYGALMIPWWIHNYRAYGTFVRLNLNLGITLYVGNNAMNKTGGGNGGIDWDVSDIMAATNDPILRDREYKRRAYSYIAESPARFFQMSFSKVARMWQPVPHNPAYTKPVVIFASLVTCGSILFLSLLYLAVWGRSEIRRTFPMLFLAAYLTAVVAVLFGTIRYRLPLEPFIIMMSAAALVRLASSWQAVAWTRAFFREPESPALAFAAKPPTL